MRYLIKALLALTLLAFVVPAFPAQAGKYDHPAALAGWTRSQQFHPSEDYKTNPYHGISLGGQTIFRGSPVIADVDGNPANGREVAVGGQDGVVYLYGADGTRRWAVNALGGSANCPFQVGDGRLHSAPAAGDLNNDGVLDIVIGYGTILQGSCDGGVVALNGSNGSVLWRFSLRQQGHNSREALFGVVSSPAIADVDGNGTLEVAFGGFDRNLYMLNNDGSIRFYYHAADTVWSSPALVNIDSDPQLELVIGTDIAGNSFFGISDGGFVYAFDTQQRNPVRIEFNGGYIWRTFFDQAIFSSPAIGNVLESNPGDEVVVGAGCFWPTGSTNKRGRYMHVLNLSTGTILQRLDSPGGGACLQSSPALGDFDGDGVSEVVGTVNGDTSIGGDGKSRIAVWKPTSAGGSIAPAATIVPLDYSSNNDPFGGDLMSPIIADLDGNSSLEIIAANRFSVNIFSYAGGTLSQLTYKGGGSSGISVVTWGGLKSTPAVGFIDTDSDLDLVIGGTHCFHPANGSNICGTSANSGMLYAWTDFAGVLGSPAGSGQIYRAPWPMFRATPDHRGIQPGLRVSRNSAGFLVDQNKGLRSLSLTVSDSNGGGLNWTASENLNWLTVSPGNGTTPAELTIMIDPSGIADGTLLQGTLTINSGLGSQAIEVSLLVDDDVQQVFVPRSVR